MNGQTEKEEIQLFPINLGTSRSSPRSPRGYFTTTMKRRINFTWNHFIPFLLLGETRRRRNGSQLARFFSLSLSLQACFTLGGGNATPDNPSVSWRKGRTDFGILFFFLDRSRALSKGIALWDFFRTKGFGPLTVGTSEFDWKGSPMRSTNFDYGNFHVEASSCL